MKIKHLIIGAAILAVCIVGASIYYVEFVQQDTEDSSATQENTPTDNEVPAFNTMAAFQGIKDITASGDVAVNSTAKGAVIQLEDNFATTSPLSTSWLFLGDAEGPKTEIAKLAKEKGSQRYEMQEIDIKDYSHIWIRSKEDNKNYAKAEMVL